MGNFFRDVHDIRLQCHWVQFVYIYPLFLQQSGLHINSIWKFTWTIRGFLLAVRSVWWIDKITIVAHTIFMGIFFRPVNLLVFLLPNANANKSIQHWKQHKNHWNWYNTQSLVTWKLLFVQLFLVYAKLSAIRVLRCKLSVPTPKCIAQALKFSERTRKQHWNGFLALIRTVL